MRRNSSLSLRGIQQVSNKEDHTHTDSGWSKEPARFLSLGGAGKVTKGCNGKSYLAPWSLLSFHSQAKTQENILKKRQVGLRSFMARLLRNLRGQGHLGVRAGEQGREGNGRW